MTPTQIQTRLARVGAVTVALNDIAALLQAANRASAYVPVRWTFEPGTPANVIDYLAGGLDGAVRGAAAGAGAGLLLSLVFPPAIIGYAVVGGAAIGAVRGVNRVHQGWRVRLVFSRAGQPLLLVRAT